MADQSQARAGLRLMMAIARADGALSQMEMEQLRAAITELAQGDDIYDLIDADIDFDLELSRVTDPEVRAATYRAAVMMSMADGEAHEGESQLLAKLRDAYGLTNVGDHVAEVLKDAEPLAPEESDPVERSRSTQDVVMVHSLIAGALGANPLPVVSFVTEAATVAVQVSLVQRIAVYYGHHLSRKEIGAMMAGTFGLGIVRAAVVQLVKFVPIWGSIVGAASGFTTTFALGETVRRHFEAGGDIASLTKQEAKHAFADIKNGEAKAEYERARERIAERAEKRSVDLELFARDVGEGKPSDRDLAAKLKGLE